MGLFGIYGSHTLEACPLYNRESAARLVAFAEDDPSPLLSKYRINRFLGQYHSAFEHTFVWVVEADDAHLVEEFAFESGLAAFNTLTIVPIKSFTEGVIPRLKKLHGL